MKVVRNFGILYILLIIIQILIGNYCRFSPLIAVTILPIMIMCLPISIRTIPAMMIAFATGLAVDWLSEGILGLNTIALVPVAAIRKPVIRLFFGSELIERNESMSIRRDGFQKIAKVVFFLHTVFLIIYVTVDGAGARSLEFNLARFAISEVLGLSVSFIVAFSLIPEDEE